MSNRAYERALLLGTAMFLSSCQVSAHAEACGPIGHAIVSQGYMNGTDLSRWDNAAIEAYSMGFLDSLLAGTLFGMPDTCRVSIKRCVEGRNSVQIAAMVRKYLNDNPGRWHEAGSVALYNALLRECLYP